jgi:hypothetical protein
MVWIIWGVVVLVPVIVPLGFWVWRLYKTSGLRDRVQDLEERVSEMEKFLII